jgi:HSP20 family protein
MARNEWDPLKELVGVQQRMNKLFESALARSNFDAEGGVGAWTPVADAYEAPERMILHVELPGLEQTDIDVRVEQGELIVQGERRMDRDPATEFHRVERSYGKFLRRFPLPPTIDRESVDARYRDGVLTVILTKQDRDRSGAIRVAVR